MLPEFGTVSSIPAFCFGSAAANGFHLRPMLGLWAALLALLHGSVTLSTHGLWIDPLQKCAKEWEGQRAEVTLIINADDDLRRKSELCGHHFFPLALAFLQTPFESAIRFILTGVCLYFIGSILHRHRCTHGGVYTWANPSPEN